MSYETTSIKNVIMNTQSGKYVLPAMQRNYVWKEEQVTRLFDSLMKGYPIGSFLFWRLSDDDISDYMFNKFMSDIDLLDGDARGDYTSPHGYSNDTYAVLDGQQRITSLLIGFTGSLRTKVKVKRKVDGDFPKRYLALNLLKRVVDKSEDEYEFCFLSDQEIAANDGEHYWFKVADILKTNIQLEDVAVYLDDNSIGGDDGTKTRNANRNLSALITALTKNDMISFYVAEQTGLAEAVEIFERINNTGQPLSGTDLMLSMASAANRTDMQKKIDDAINQVENATNSDTGFIPDRAFILTAALMAIEKESISTTKRENYSSDRIGAILNNWDDVINAICNASIYLDRLGFNGKKLSKSFLHPIVYYFFKLGSDGDAKKRFASADPNCVSDRSRIVQWILRAHICGQFDSGVSKALVQIRDTMKDALKPPNNKAFPLDALMAHGDGTSLTVTEDDLLQIVGWKYGDPRVYPLLTFLQKEGGQWDNQVDHIWPQSKMASDAKIRTALASQTLSEEDYVFYKKKFNLLPNLMILERFPNVQKGDKYFDEYLAEYADGPRNQFIANHLIPDVDYSYTNFREFYEAREELLLDKLRDYFGISKQS